MPSQRVPILGVVTIGESPRPDLERAFGAHASGARVVVRGALDGLSGAEIDRLTRVATEYPLLVRLNDGTGCAIAMEALYPLVRDCAGELAGEGARVVVVACAGGFPAVPCPVPVVLPGKIVPAVIGAVATTRCVGVVTPIAAQVPSATLKWQGDGFDAVVTSASPMVHDEIERASAVMRDAFVEMVVLDCIGHDEAYAMEFADRCGKRVITAQSLAARVAGEWMR